MIYAVVLLLLLIAALEWLRIRAARNHTTILTVLHSELSGLGDTLEKLESKFDGGSIPK